MPRQQFRRNYYEAISNVCRVSICKLFVGLPSRRHSNNVAHKELCTKLGL
jgi:hypothetical protein